MLKGIANAFRIPELRKKILFTLGIILLYRFGAYLPAPGVPFNDMMKAFSNAASNSGAIAVLNMFSGGALSRVSVFSLGIMPYITAQIILQLLQAVIPSLAEKAQDTAGQNQITQYTRYLTVGLALLNAVGYFFLFKSYGISFDAIGFPEAIEAAIIIGVLVTGAIIIMWLGELMTQNGVGNGMSLIIFTNIMAGFPSALTRSFQSSTTNTIITVVTLIVLIAIIPLIVYIERGQRRIPVTYGTRTQGNQQVRGQSTYIPIKVNTAGVVPIIFASALLYLPAQIAVFFPNVGWIQAFANTLAAGGVNWTLSVVLIVFFAYFYTSMVFNPEEISKQLGKAGGYIPGYRPGRATAEYIKSVLSHITLPGAIFMAALAIVPSILFSLTGNQLLQSFGGTSVLIMVGVAMDTLAQVESQLEMHNYEGMFK